MTPKINATQMFNFIIFFSFNGMERQDFGCVNHVAPWIFSKGILFTRGGLYIQEESLVSTLTVMLVFLDGLCTTVSVCKKDGSRNI